MCRAAASLAMLAPPVTPVRAPHCRHPCHLQLGGQWRQHDRGYRGHQGLQLHQPGPHGEGAERRDHAGWRGDLHSGACTACKAGTREHPPCPEDPTPCKGVVTAGGSSGDPRTLQLFCAMEWVSAAVRARLVDCPAAACRAATFRGPR